MTKADIERILSRAVPIPTAPGVVIYREGNVSEHLPVEGSRESKVAHDGSAPGRPAIG